MPRFKHYNCDQDTMVVINYREQLQPGTFEHAVHYLIEHKLDLTVFHPKYRNNDTGRLAYDPAILLKIILFAYSKGITSSREIQWCCLTNIIFKALFCDTVPHFTGAIVTADTGFANEANMKYLHEHQIDGYIPDNRFRSGDPKFAESKEKYGKRQQTPSKSGWKHVIPSSEFQFDPVTMTCICPAGESLRHEGTRTDQNGVPRAHFQGRLLQCRHCPKKHQCMQPAEQKEGARSVAIVLLSAQY
jgi:hypothetical protein